MQLFASLDAQANPTMFRVVEMDLNLQIGNVSYSSTITRNPTS